VRIEHQNLRGLYFGMICLSTLTFALFCDTLYGALRHRDDVFYLLPLFALALICYLLALAMAVWGAFGIEQIAVEAGSLRWTLSALKWTRTRHIPTTDVTEIRAITPWHGLNNTVEVTAAGKQQRIGDKLLHDEAVELAKHLRRAVGLIK
jgi:hypothetical protein